MAIRYLAARLSSQRQRALIGDYFVAAAPQKIQRASERLFDFPIPCHIRTNPILLIRIPRTGSASTSMVIYGRVEGIPHRRAIFYQRSDPLFFRKAMKITVVRNPWDRVVSAYNFLRGNGAALAKPNPQTQQATRGLKSLDELVFDYLLPNANRLHRLDPTLHDQHGYVCDAKGDIIVDKIFRSEAFDEISHFMSSRGLAEAVPHLNSSASSEYSGRRLPDRLVEAIATIYAKDISLFGYRYAAPALPVPALDVPRTVRAGEWTESAEGQIVTRTG